MNAMRWRPIPIADVFAKIDLVLLLAAAALALLGLVMVASASITIADRSLDAPLYYFWKQLIVLGGASVIGLVLVLPGLGVWQRAGAPALIVGALMLALVLSFGREVNGSTRWLQLGPISVQPSELMKLVVVVYMAGYLVRRGAEVRRALWGFVKPVALLGIIALLLLLEPDYGATVVMFATALGMLFLAGVPLIAYAVWVVVIGSGLAALAIAAPYRLERLTTFLNPWADPYDSGFQLTQALIAIGRGEWFGVGLGGSVQKLFYLPEAHTDFLFAVLGEELGVFGMVVVIALFATVVCRAFMIARRAEQQGRLFGAHLAYGLGLVIGLQAFINIGVNLGVLPTKGLALPFMSYGANSLVVNCLGLALLLRVSYECAQPQELLSVEEPAPVPEAGVPA
ncbi:MAG: cell division protein FtsW [Gammaproteobacteria bacterium]|jgi:cell division protein FtsW